MKRQVFKKKLYSIKRKRSIFKNRWFWLGIFLFFILCGIFYFVYFSPFFQIKEVKITGNQKTSTQKIETIIKNKINNKILFVSSKSIFLPNLKKANQEILDKFPQVYKVDFKKNFPDKIECAIIEREPVVVIRNKGVMFFSDKLGIVFEIIENIPLNIMAKIDLNLDNQLKLGQLVIEEKLLSQLLNVNYEMENSLKIKIESISVVSKDLIEVKTSEDWLIYFDPNNDFDWQITKLKTVLEKEIALDKRKNLEYIDLRFGNFAPYKFK